MKRFGVMLDCSRNAVMKPEQVKKLAEVLKSFGYTMLKENEPFTIQNSFTNLIFFV